LQNITSTNNNSVGVLKSHVGRILLSAFRL